MKTRGSDFHAKKVIEVTTNSITMSSEKLFQDKLND